MIDYYSSKTYEKDFLLGQIASLFLRKHHFNNSDDFIKRWENIPIDGFKTFTESNFTMPALEVETWLVIPIITRHMSKPKGPIVKMILCSVHGHLSKIAMIKDDKSEMIIRKIDRGMTNYGSIKQCLAQSKGFKYTIDFTVAGELKLGLCQNNFKPIIKPVKHGS